MRAQKLGTDGSRRMALAAALALAAASGALLAGGAGAQEQRQFGNTEVTADVFEYDLEKQQFIAVGSVELVSGASRLTSDKMTVQLGKNRQLDWARCEGKVFLQKKTPDNSVSLTGRGQTLDYYEAQEKAILMGGVQVQLTSPRLGAPALITGSRVEMDLKSQENVVLGGAGAQAKVHLVPRKGETGPAPEPVDLLADRIEMNSEKQQYVATGKPVLVRPSSRLQARRIRFEMEESGTDLKVAQADEEVVFDGRSANGSLLHTTADRAVYTVGTRELVMTGMVTATITDPGEDKPQVMQGGEFIFNTRTRAANLKGSSRATLIIPPGKLPLRRPAEEARPNP